MIMIRIRFQFWIRIHGFDVQNWKIYRWQKVHNFWTKKCNIFIPRPPWRASKLQEKPPALKREHPALQACTFTHHFFFVCVIFVHLDPDPGTSRPKSMQILIRTYSTDQGFESGSAWIRINLSCWIRIRIQIADPDPGGQKLPTKI